MQQGTGKLVVFASHLLGLSAHYNPDTQLFNVAGFDMRLLEECVALHYHAILTLAIILTPGQLVRRKLAALVCCNAALVFFNILRLILLGVIGNAYPDLFYAVHDYVWQVAFAILTFFLCVAWLKTRRDKRKTRFGFLVASFGFSAVFALIMNAFKLSYLAGLVWLGDKFLLLTRFGEDWSLRWWAITKKSFVMVRLQGEKVFYLTPAQPFTVSLWQDMLDLALFWGFCAGALLWLWRSNAALSLKKITLGMILGTTVLAGVHLATVVILGWLLLADPNMDLGANFLWFIRGISVLLPVALWYLLHRFQNRDRLNSFPPYIAVQK